MLGEEGITRGIGDLMRAFFACHADSHEQHCYNNIVSFLNSNVSAGSCFLTRSFTVHDVKMHICGVFGTERKSLRDLMCLVRTSGCVPYAGMVPCTHCNPKRSLDKGAHFWVLSSKGGATTNKGLD